MKANIFFIVLLLTLSSGCVNFDVLTDSSSVFNLNLVITGNYSNPSINTDNTTRSTEMVPLVKQHRYNEIVELPYIACEVFYKTDKISYYTSLPYYGADVYNFKIVFKDDKPIPNSSDEAVTVLVRIVGSDGEYIAKEYISVRWP